MKLIKIEKPFCPACDEVAAFLADTGVEYSILNIQAGKESEQDQARKFLGQLGLFTVPVTIVLGEDNTIIDHARGMDRVKLQELVELVK